MHDSDVSREQIVAEIAKLSTEEREALWHDLWALEELEMLKSGPTAEEKAILDAEWKDYLKNPDEGEPWEKVKALLQPDP